MSIETSPKEHARGIEIRKLFALYRDYADDLMRRPRESLNVGQQRFLARWIEQRHPAVPEDWWNPGHEAWFEANWTAEHPA